MKKLMLAVLLLGNALVGCGPAEPVEAPDADATSQEAALSGGTWQISSFEDCYAMYGGSCYSRRWEPACSWQTGSASNPSGLACSPVGTYCWWVRDARYVYEYECR